MTEDPAIEAAKDVIRETDSGNSGGDFYNTPHDRDYIVARKCLELQAEVEEHRAVKCGKTIREYEAWLEQETRRRKEAEAQVESLRKTAEKWLTEKDQQISGLVGKVMETQAQSEGKPRSLEQDLLKAHARVSRIEMFLAGMGPVNGTLEDAEAQVEILRRALEEAEAQATIDADNRSPNRTTEFSTRLGYIRVIAEAALASTKVEQHLATIEGSVSERKV